MSGIGLSHGCISVVNGIVNGKAAVIGTVQETEAVYREADDEQIVRIIGEETEDNLVRICVRRTLERLGIDTDIGYRLTIKSDIPPSRGLKSSSSVCNAVVKSVLDAYGSDLPALDAVLLGVECAREAKVTVTGSFDDACGCEFGGLIYTDNYKDAILRREPFGKYDVVLCTPDRTKVRVPRERYMAESAQMEAIQKIAETDPLRALTLNGALIAKITGENTDLMDRALKYGALAAGISGTGPAVAVVAESGAGRDIAAQLPCRTIVTETR